MQLNALRSSEFSSLLSTRGSDGLAQGILTLKKEFGRDLKTRTKALDMILVQLPPHQFLKSDWTEHESIEKGINTFGCV